MLSVLKELYSGSKDCNILAWIPSLRESVPDDIDEKVINLGVWTILFVAVMLGGVVWELNIKYVFHHQNL